ncbi:hypothetical protein [Glutamicibacter creatinolyticus]|uniref:VG15 protein n=1 Tax=Glutamicibacter creatinolyticus TaxID=162496 RepID=UPI0032167350
MTTRAQVQQLRDANRQIVELVSGELQAIFYSLNLNKPELARDALLELFPLLVDKYGPLAAQVAVEWYREVLPGTNPVAASSAYPLEALQKKVRYAAGDLFTDDPYGTLRNLTGALGKYVRQPGRDTIQINAMRDKVGWARVPRGPRTCSFCLMLASRSGAWLYNTKEKALSRKSDGEEYHGNCNCEAVLVRDADEMPEGFDHQGAYVAYTIAREATKEANPTTAEITYQIRRLFPEIVTDGVVAPL